MSTPTSAEAPTLGLFAINSHACADPRVAARIAAAAERLGYESLWAGDHVVVPRPRVAPSPMEPDEPLLDPVVALTHVAAATTRIRLGTGIIILPQRNPLVLAKQLASLDVVSGGRLMFGIAVGYLEPELRALGVPVRERAQVAEEYLAAMRSLWYEDEPSFDGRYVRFSEVDAYPRPVQRPLPVIMGGNSAAAHQRAVRIADGWYGWWLDPESAATQIASLRAEEARAGRAHPLEVSVTPGVRLDAEIVRAYGGLGVHRLIVVPRPNLAGDDLERFVEANAPARLGATAV